MYSSEPLKTHALRTLRRRSLAYHLHADRVLDPCFGRVAAAEPRRRRRAAAVFSDAHSDVCGFEGSFGRFEGKPTGNVTIFWRVPAFNTHATTILPSVDGRNLLRAWDG